MTWFLDTNICIYLLKGTSPEARETLLSKKPSDIKIPAMTLAELYVGGAKSEKSDDVLSSIREFAKPFEIVPFDERAAFSYGEIRAALLDGGLKVGPNDITIAATAMSRDGILVTNNEKDFAKIVGLPMENWTQTLDTKK